MNSIGAKGGYAPSYNVQISTDATAKIIVGVGVTQSSSDVGELEPAVKRIEENLGLAAVSVRAPRRPAGSPRR